MAAKANPTTPTSSLADVEVIKFLLMHAFYLSLNFVPLAALLSLYFVYQGYTFAYVIVTLGAIDLLLPLNINQGIAGRPVTDNDQTVLLTAPDDLVQLSILILLSANGGRT